MSAEIAYKRFVFIISQSVNTVLSVLKILIKSKFGIHLPKAVSESCIVLGNGPSLKQSLQNHPNFFKNHPLICVNSFSLTEQYGELKPEYYVMLDPSFWYENDEFAKNTIECIKEKTTWKLYLLIPQHAANSAVFQELIIKNSNIILTPFNYTVFKGFEWAAHKVYINNLAMMQSQNVLVATLFLSINIGFKKIYLVGADHSWLETLVVNENNEVCFKSVHFYENENRVGLHPFYKGAHTKEIFRMDEILIIWGKTFYGYTAINNYASSRHSVIYNASEFSFIDAFKRIKL